MKYLSITLALASMLNFLYSEEPREKILFVGTSWVIAKYVKPAVEDLGYTPIFLVNIEDFSDQIAQEIRKSQWHEVNIKDYSAVEDFILSHKDELGSIVGITSLSDSKLPIAQKLAETFNVLGPDQAIQLLADKNMVNCLIPEYSPPTISFFMDAIPLDYIDEMIDRYGAIVIKPAKGSGALGTVILTDKVDKAVLCKLLSDSGATHIDSLEWLAQSYIQGVLYSLEGYCLDGKPHFLGLTRRSRVSMTEMANHFPSDNDHLVKNHEKMLYDGIYALIERSGYKKGYFHCEYLLNENGAYLIDANFGRIGGAAMIEQFAHSFEITPEEMTKHVIDICLFGGKHLSSYSYKAHPKPSLCLCYGLEKEGFLKSVTFGQEISSRHTIASKCGAWIPSIGNSDYSWVGMLAGDPKAVLEDIEKIRIETQEGLQSAYYFID